MKAEEEDDDDANGGNTLRGTAEKKAGVPDIKCHGPHVKIL